MRKVSPFVQRLVAEEVAWMIKKSVRARWLDFRGGCCNYAHLPKLRVSGGGGRERVTLSAARRGIVVEIGVKHAV